MGSSWPPTWELCVQRGFFPSVSSKCHRSPKPSAGFRVPLSVSWQTQWGFWVSPSILQQVKLESQFLHQQPIKPAHQIPGFSISILGISGSSISIPLSPAGILSSSPAEGLDPHSDLHISPPLLPVPKFPAVHHEAPLFGRRGMCCQCPVLGGEGLCFFLRLGSPQKTQGQQELLVLPVFYG